MTVVYKAAWTSPDEVADALEGTVGFEENRIARQRVPFYSERSAWSTADARLLGRRAFGIQSPQLDPV